MYEQFVKSMKVDYGKGHDGIGYDLGALRNLSAGEQARVEICWSGVITRFGGIFKPLM